MQQQEALQDDNFLTLTSIGKGLYKEKGSKFIAYAYPVRSTEDVKARIEELKVEYHDARHWCYGYRIDPLQPKIRANDDGEPSNSAGVPIYNQILAKELWNTLVVVVRYFGGTKLGVSGLVRAYKEAAAESLANAQLNREYLKDEVSIEFPYANMNDIMRLIKEMDLEIISENMGLQAGYTLAARLNDYQLLVNRLEAIHTVKVL